MMRLGLFALSPKPEIDLGHGHEFALDLAVHGALEAHEQLLVEDGGDALESRQLRNMGSLLESRHSTMGSTRRLGDLLLGESQLEATLPQMRGNRADLPKGADTLVFGARVAIGLVAPSATLGRIDSITSDGIVKGASRRAILSWMVSVVRCHVTPKGHRVPPREAVDEDARLSLLEILRTVRQGLLFYMLKLLACR
jgi:hypothetical protein